MGTNACGVNPWVSISALAVAQVSDKVTKPAG